MLKMCSLVTVIGFCAFWVFGFLALTGDGAAMLTTGYAFAAFVGLAAGSFAYLRLCRVMPGRKKG
jgi:hypothetical protein